MTSNPVHAQAHPSSSEIFAATLTLAAGTAAYGAIIKYANPPLPDSRHFSWGTDSYPDRFLDVRLSAGDQQGLVEVPGLTFGCYFAYGMASGPPNSYPWGQLDAYVRSNLYGGAGIHVFNPGLHDQFASYEFAQRERFGDVLGPSSSFNSYALLSAFFPDFVVYGTGEWGTPEYYNTYYPGINYTPFQDGSATFGVRFYNPDTLAYHYGWITVEIDLRSFLFSSGGVNGFADIVALKSWAWETEPNTPITIPAPAGIAALAFGAAGLARRGRREGDHA